MNPFQLIDEALIEAEDVVDEFVSEWAALDLVGSRAEKEAAVAQLPARRGRGGRPPAWTSSTSAPGTPSATCRRTTWPACGRRRTSGWTPWTPCRRPASAGTWTGTSGRLATLARELDRRDAALRELVAALSEDAATPAEKIRAADFIAEAREALLRDARGVQVVQTGLRVEQIVLNPFDLPLDEAVRIALESRLDLMNQRAIVTDSRRQLELAANALQAVLDVVADGSVGTRPQVSGDGFINRNPFGFRGDQTSFRVGRAVRHPAGPHRRTQPVPGPP